MRALTQTLQARQDAKERIYQPTVKIFINVETKRDVSVLKGALEMLIQKKPWQNSMVQFVEVDFGNEVDEKRTITVYENCPFEWSEDEQCFRSVGLLPLRRGQLAAFENWVNRLVHEACVMRLSGVIIASTRSVITFERKIGPFIRG